MAPEVMCRQNHTTSVDYFAVGVMAYECMFGRVSVPNSMTEISYSFKSKADELLYFKLIISFEFCRDPTLERAGKKSGTTSFPSKYRSREMTYPEDGQLKQQTSLTK